MECSHCETPTQTLIKMGYKELCGSVHTVRHRHRHRHRCNWVANPFCRSRCRCRAVYTTSDHSNNLITRMFWHSGIHNGILCDKLLWLTFNIHHVSGQLSSYNSTLSIDSSVSPYTGKGSSQQRVRGDPTVFAVISGQGRLPKNLRHSFCCH